MQASVNRKERKHDACTILDTVGRQCSPAHGCGVIVVDKSGNKTDVWKKKHRSQTLTMGPGGPLGPDDPSFPGGP